MSAPAVAYEQPPAWLTHPVAEALAKLPRAKQEEILLRLAIAAVTGDESQLDTLTVALRGITDPSTRPHIDPETAVTVPVEEFLAMLDSFVPRDS